VSPVIRDARPEDAPAILELMRALAEYEKLLDIFENTEERIRETLLSPAPRVFCAIGEIGGAPAGYALWFYTYSTFRGRHGIWLEDLFVRPEHRGSGLGKAFMRMLARRCAEEGLSRVEWSVLDWNAPSIAFYESLGANPQGGWTAYRLADEALARLAAAPR
jgi:GNAT superfamily N-acetyltransferase